MALSPDIGIVGAGLGGMTAAVALQQRGYDVTVYEQAPALGEIGAGITAGPNISMVLDGLGLEDATESFAGGSKTFGTLHYKTGARLLYWEPSLEDALKNQGALTRHMHRADLHKVLEDAAVLARCLEAEKGDWRAAFVRYERARLARANKFHVQSHERGRIYMSADPTDRARAATAGMEAEFSYNAMTVDI